MNNSHTFLRLFFLVLLCAVVTFLPRAAAPQQATTQASSATLRRAGLRAPVTIRRDGRGVPYIEATNDIDLYFGTRVSDPTTV